MVSFKFKIVFFSCFFANEQWKYVKSICLAGHFNILLLIRLTNKSYKTAVVSFVLLQEHLPTFMMSSLMNH